MIINHFNNIMCVVFSTLRLVRFWFLIAVTICWSLKGYSQNSITVTIKNLRNNNGHILLSLFNQSKGWPEDEANTLRKVEIPIKNKTATISFTNMPAGTYAVAIMHDENDNYRMDKTMFGMPKEGFGFSNDVMGTFGPPGFKESSFKHYNNTDVVIKIRYW